QPVHPPLHFIIYGDLRATDPSNTRAADAVRRQLLIQRIAEQKPALLVVSGDVVYRGDNPDDWKEWEKESQPLRDASIPVYPVLGNHDMGRNIEMALANWWEHMPQVAHKRWYSVQAGPLYFLILDSSADQAGGDEW